MRIALRETSTMLAGTGADGIDRRTRSAPRSASSGRIQQGKKKQRAGLPLSHGPRVYGGPFRRGGGGALAGCSAEAGQRRLRRYWREGGQVRCRDADSAGGESRPGALEALLASGRRNFEELLPKLAAELLGRGAAMRRHQRKSKRFTTWTDPVLVERTYYRRPDCGSGHFPFDRTLGNEGSATRRGRRASSRTRWSTALRDRGPQARKPRRRVDCHDHAAAEGEKYQRAATAIRARGRRSRRPAGGKELPVD